MKTVRDIASLRQAIRCLREEGKRIALVPTMGALHAGHISLVRLAQKNADAVVASIFVNPTQFGPNEDFSKYPRTEESDLQELLQANTTLAYLPQAAEMYPPGATTRVHVKGLSEVLCGAYRPGHFEGVATIVTKLFMQVMPDVAIFGEKDFQQLAVIRRFTHDLDIPLEIIGAPIMREADGLAMSSRNRYLNVEQRGIAPLLFRCMNEAVKNIQTGTRVSQALEHAQKTLLTGGFNKIDYLELCNAQTLAPIEQLNSPARLLAAAYIGTTRLIDNVEVVT